MILYHDLMIIMTRNYVLYLLFFFNRFSIFDEYSARCVQVSCNIILNTLLWIALQMTNGDTSLLESPILKSRKIYWVHAFWRQCDDSGEFQNVSSFKKLPVQIL